MNIRISSGFKKHAKNTIYSILIFIVVYILLFTLAVGITFALGFLGIWIMVMKPMIWTLLIGGGLIISGLMILFFLIKFIFSSNKMDRSHLTEITKEEQPQIFAMIEEIVKEVDTTFPKKVYLTNDVNASVFYDSNFWSMFFPIKKNLIIGIGLMNAVTQQEFKAILAHEFGHFSQRSMKVGSYVYQVNQVIYNMLYKNDSFENMISMAAGLHSLVAICVAGSIWVIKQIQWILQKLYNYVNINYMSLSREMEFHADEIAAHVAGSQHLASSLLRLDFANNALDSTFGFYENKVKENIRSNNVYQEQSFVMKFLAEKNKYNLLHNLPQIEIEHLSKYNKSKLNIENQWASHPNTEDRIAALYLLNIQVDSPNNNPAIELLHHKEKYMQLMTDNIFAQVTFSSAPHNYTLTQFQTEFMEQYDKNSFDPIFNNYYDINNPIVDEFEIDLKESSTQNLSELYTDDYAALTFELNSLKEDFVLLKSIETGELQIKTFDYDGVKYQSNEASTLISKIESEIKSKEDILKQHNQTIYNDFTVAAHKLNLDEPLKNVYIALKKLDDAFVSKQELYRTLNDKTQFVFMTTGFGEIDNKLLELKPYEETLKEELKTYLPDAELTKDIDAENMDKLKKYVENELRYFYVDTYDDNSLTHLYTAINHYYYLISREYFLQKKRILQLQKQIMSSQIN